MSGHTIMMGKFGKGLGIIALLLQCNFIFAKELIYLPGGQNSDQLNNEPYQPITADSSLDLRSKLSQYSKSAISGTLNPAIFNQDTTELMIGLPDNTALRVKQKTFSNPGQNHSKWIGAASDDPNSSVLITTYKGITVGRITKAGRVYELKPGISQTYILEELDTQAFPQCGNDAQQLISSKAAIDNPSDSNAAAFAGAPVVIDLLAVYTVAARNRFGGDTGIRAHIQAAVDNANLAFADSAMDITFQLIHTALVNRIENTSSSDLIWVRDDPGVKNLRNQVGADMVSLITDSNYCGRGYVQTNPGPSFQSFAVQVTDVDCAVGNLTFAHEHGHNMGMEHDPANGASPANASFPYSFGHFVNGVYRTVMSYSDPCANGCTRVPHFSNPDILHAGNATGIANQRDNARTGRFTAPIIAAFRTSGTPPGSDDDDILLFLPAILSGAKKAN